jgi:hypothetical protein
MKNKPAVFAAGKRLNTRERDGCAEIVLKMKTISTWPSAKKKGGE